MPRDPSIDGRALQWSDLKAPQRKIVSDNIREVGANLPDIARQSAETLHRTHERTGNKQAKVKAESAEAVAEHLQSKPVSLQTAANSRQRLYNRGVEDRAAANPDDPHQVIPTGAGWYFEHHREIAATAEQHGFNRDRAIAASGVMSPQNSPENERAAVGAIMDAYANRKVHVDENVHDHLAQQGIDVSDHLGKTVLLGDLPTGSVAHLSTSGFRDTVQTDADLKNVARGGTKQNIIRAEKVLTGETHPDEAVDPHSAPKVWSYVHNTRQAVPDSPLHVEYMGRVHQDALVRRGHIDKEQQALDLYGFQAQEARGELPHDSLLSSESHTVEDTWQNSATFDQPKTSYRTGPASKPASTFKAAGSLPETYPVRGVKTRTNEETGKRESAHPDARIGNPALTHAFNNRATQKASEQLSRESGSTVPPVAVQEVGWVQMRKDAGKDPAFNAEQRSAPKADALEGHIRGQGALFEMTDRAGEVRGDLPGAGRTPLDRPKSSPEVDMTPADQESDMRKWAAIGNNVRRGQQKRENFGGLFNDRREAR